jgi:prefoldin subunit 5
MLTFDFAVPVWQLIIIIIPVLVGGIVWATKVNESIEYLKKKEASYEKALEEIKQMLTDILIKLEHKKDRD